VSQKAKQDMIRRFLRPTEKAAIILNIKMHHPHPDHSGALWMHFFSDKNIMDAL
jgi:hypothetical protein